MPPLEKAVTKRTHRCLEQHWLNYVQFSLACNERQRLVTHLRYIKSRLSAATEAKSVRSDKEPHGRRS